MAISRLLRTTSDPGPACPAEGAHCQEALAPLGGSTGGGEGAEGGIQRRPDELHSGQGGCAASGLAYVLLFAPGEGHRNTKHPCTDNVTPMNYG